MAEAAIAKVEALLDDDQTASPARSDGLSLRRARTRAFTVFGALLGTVALGYGAYAWITGERYVTTDNAYVNAEVARVTPLVSGQVAEVRVVDTKAVKRGDVLVVIDPSDARIAVSEAEAELARAVRRVEQTIAAGSALSSQVMARRAGIERAHAAVASARADFDKARIGLARREALVESGAVSGDELTTARNAFADARAKLAAADAALSEANAMKASARGEFAANDALVRNTTVERHPEVQAARARLDRARLDLARTVIRAPIGGVIAQRSVQVGQRVAPGVALMAVVPIDAIYVDANFKEVQLRRVRPGQPVELTSDLYGEDVVYRGRVAGFSGGTGSAFATIPAQNATGNWIKVVQRLPVRVVLDPRDVQAHPLRVGLSMTATIDTGSRD